ncbi:hypothetical protein J6590_063367 [Homalodisca vitripennis]|nr:hypothetical protein J6590_063367 [Homalodisca vitripennis]
MRLVSLAVIQLALRNLLVICLGTTTKDGVPLPCYCWTMKEQVFSSFLLLVTHSTERILPKDADSVKVLPQMTLSRNQIHNPRH